MTAKEHLGQIIVLNAKINQKLQEKTELRASLTSISSPDFSKERVQGGSPSSDPVFAKRIIKLISLEEEIDEMLDELVDKKHLIIGQIHSLGNANHIKVLYKCYVDGKTLKVIAREMNYTYQHVRRLHTTALQEFEKCYKMLQ